MNGPSKITVDYSSLVGLKAELLRKRTEAREIKAKGSTQKLAKNQKPKVKVKKSQEKDKSSPKVTEIEDVDALKKSKLMLEAKSRLYDKLQKSHSSANDLFLVDFSHKPDPESEKSESEDDLGNENYDSDDNFVEYKDCFGRTRKCLREDLPKMQEKDNLLRQQISKEPPSESVEEETIEKSPQREPEIEIMRRKWEEQTKKLADKANIYYQDVLFDEARAHGVGYYNFSMDEEERTKQQENLEKLRKETEQKQKEMQDLKERRKKMEQNRLKVARIRQRIRAGLSPELPEDEEVPRDETKNSVEDKPQNSDAEKKEESVEEKKAPEKENSLSIIEDKVKAFGDLLGKRTHWREMSQEEWVEKRRKDRLSEFAPIYNGFKSAGCIDFGDAGYKDGKAVSNERISAMDEDNDDSEVIGPFPMSIPLPPTPTPPVNEDKDEEESDDSDIIGPLPPTDLPTFSPFPTNPLPSMIPLPPSPKKSSSNPEVCIDDLKVKNTVDSEKIAAGLRYLREKFEREKKGNN